MHYVVLIELSDCTFSSRTRNAAGLFPATETSIILASIVHRHRHTASPAPLSIFSHYHPQGRLYQVDGMGAMQFGTVLYPLFDVPCQALLSATPEAHNLPVHSTSPSSATLPCPSAVTSSRTHYKASVPGDRWLVSTYVSTWPASASNIRLGLAAYPRSSAEKESLFVNSR